MCYDRNIGHICGRCGRQTRHTTTIRCFCPESYRKQRVCQPSGATDEVEEDPPCASCRPRSHSNNNPPRMPAHQPHQPSRPHPRNQTMPNAVNRGPPDHFEGETVAGSSRLQQSNATSRAGKPQKQVVRFAEPLVQNRQRRNTPNNKKERNHSAPQDVRYSAFQTYFRAYSVNTRDGASNQTTKAC